MTDDSAVWGCSRRHKHKVARILENAVVIVVWKTNKQKRILV